MATATAEKPTETKDNGLGMDTFLQAPPVETAEAPKVEAGETKPETTPDEKPVESKQEKPVETVETKPADTEKDVKELAKLTKQLKDTRDAFTQERQVNKGLQAKMQTLESSIALLHKKLDGTYDEEKDAPKPPTSAEIEAEARRAATITTSHFAAVEYLMARDHLSQEEADMKVKALVWNEDAPFRAFDQDKAVQARVMGAHVPIIEALKVVQEAEDRKKYGADPATMRQNMEKELRTTIAKEEREKVLKELKGKGVALEEVRGLGDVRSVSPERAPQADAALTLESLFPNFKP